MKFSKAIALCLIGMIAFCNVDARASKPLSTTSEPAAIGAKRTEMCIPVVMPNFALANIHFVDINEMVSINQTTTRVKECRPCPCDAISQPEIRLKVGWCEIIKIMPGLKG